MIKRLLSMLLVLLMLVSVIPMGAMTVSAQESSKAVALGGAQIKKNGDSVRFTLIP